MAGPFSHPQPEPPRLVRALDSAVRHPRALFAAGVVVAGVLLGLLVATSVLRPGVGLFIVVGITVLLLGALYVRQERAHRLARLHTLRRH